MYKMLYTSVVPLTVCGEWAHYSLVHSFTHSGDLYSASSIHNYSEALPAQSPPKKKDFREMYNLKGQAISKEVEGTQLNGEIMLMGPKPKRTFAAP